MNLKHESAYRIFVGIPIPLIILFIPVAVRLLTSPTYFFALSITAVTELVLIILFVVRGIILWRCSGFGISSRKIMVKKGFLHQEYKKIKTSAVTSFELQRSILQAVFGISRLEIHTPNAISNSIYLSKERTFELMEHLNFSRFSHAEIRYSTSLGRILLMSITGSNAITGLFIIIPIVKTAVIDIFNKLSNTAMEFLPFRNRILTSLTVVFFVGWFVCSLDKLIRFYSFKVWKNENKILASGGLFFRYIRQLETKKIYAVDIRETLLSIFLGLSSVYTLVPGCNRHRNRKLAFLPCAKLNELNRILRTFFPYSEEVICTLKTPSKYKLNYFVVALNTLWITIVAALKIGENTFAFAAVIIVICLWDIAVAFFAMKRSGIKICTDCVIICGKRFFTLHTQKINREKIDNVIITRNPFEKYSGLCTVKIYVKGVRAAVKCRHLPFERAYMATSRL